jgi:hypothetical protein
LRQRLVGSFERMSSTDLKLNVAGIVVAILCDGYDCDFEVGDVYRPFIAGEGEAVETVVRVRREHPPESNWGEEILGMGSTWHLYRRTSEYVLDIPSRLPKSFPHRVAVFNRDFKTGTVYLFPPELSAGYYPLASQLDQFWMTNLLSLGRGIMVHACGIDDDGKGLVFVGPSDAGKSTLAELLKKHQQAVILSDECVILREVGGRFWAYGTPWGDVAGASPMGVPLAKVFFIKHAPQNTVKHKQGAEAVAALLSLTFGAPYDPIAMQHTLEFCSRLVEQVPCYELGFVPDESVLSVIRNVP